VLARRSVGDSRKQPSVPASASLPFPTLSSSTTPSLIDASCPHCSPRCKYRDRTPVYKSLFSLVPRLSTRHCPPRTCCRSPCCGAVAAERRRLLSVDISCPLGTQQQNVCVCVCLYLPSPNPGPGGSVAEWLACWTRAQNGPGSNRSRDAVG